MWLDTYIIYKEEMNKKLSQAIKYILSAGVAAILLYFSFREVKWEDFIQGLRECRWEYIILSMTAGVAAFWFRGGRWRQLILPFDHETSRITTFNAVNIGYIANFVFPRIGEFVRCGVITRRSAPSEDGSGQKKATYEKVLGTVVLERSWELLVMLLLLAVVVVGGFNRFGGFFVEQIWTPMTERFDSGAWWIVALFAALSGFGLYALWRFRKTNALCMKVWGIFRGILQGFASCMKMEKKWLFFAYTATIWILYWIMAASTMWAVPFMDELDLIDALFLSLVGGLGFAVPVPGGIGAFHFIISLTLATMYGVPTELGIVYATLSVPSEDISIENKDHEPPYL